MRRLWPLAAGVVLAVIVAVQVLTQTDAGRLAHADIPTVAPGVDILSGIPEIPVRVRGNDYRRAAFGDAWDDLNDAPGGHNGCGTRFLGGFDVLGETLQEVGFKPGTLR